MRKTPLLTMLALGTALLWSGSSARAALSITNGDFESGAGSMLTDVTDWFDYNGEGLAWWQQTSQDNTDFISPFPDDSSYLFLSGNDTSFEYWAYQSIGTNNDGAESLKLAFDAGTLDDAGAMLDREITLALYQSDGTYAGGADNVDIAGADGAVLVDSFSVTTGAIGPGEVVSLSGSLDLGTDTTNEMFLRISNASVDNPAAEGLFQYVGIDNLQVVPEPASAWLLGAGLLGIGLGVARRR